MNKSGPVPPHCSELGNCWLWTGKTEKDGYGRLNVDGRRITAHRFSYKLEYGAFPPPAKPFACHHCDNRRCVRPSHLFAGTHQENMDDMVAKGRQVNQVMKGEMNPSAKLTWDAVESIRLEYALGLSTQRELGKRFGVRADHIKDIIASKCWKHRPPLEGSAGISSAQAA